MRLIDADGVLEEINKNKLLAREPAASTCMEVIKNATTYVEPPKKCLTGVWIPITEQLPTTEDGYAHVLVSMDDGFVCTTDYIDTDGFELWLDSGEVLAWMPLPEPYRPEALRETAQDAAGQVLQSAT